MKSWQYYTFLFLTLFLTGCFLAGGADGSPSAAEGVANAASGWLNLVIPGLGSALAVAAKMASDAIRTKNSLFDATKHAIDSGDLTNAKSKEEVKAALATGQSVHDNSKLLAKQYETWKQGGVFKQNWNRLKSLLFFWKK